MCGIWLQSRHRYGKQNQGLPLPDTAHLPHLSHELATDADNNDLASNIHPVAILNRLWLSGLGASHIPIGSGIAYRKDFSSLKLDNLQ